MREIKEKRMQSYFLRAKKMLQEGKNKEGAEMLSEGLNYYSKNIIKSYYTICNCRRRNYFYGPAQLGRWYRGE